jgi:hypothetical protein
MEYQTNVFPTSPVASRNDSFMENHRVGATKRDHVNGVLDIFDALYGPHAHTVYQGHHDGSPGIPVHDPFHANLFP